MNGFLSQFGIMCFCLLQWQILLGSDIVEIHGGTNRQSIVENGLYLLDQSRQLTLEEALEKEFVSKDKIPSIERPYHLDYSYWAQYELKNSADTSIQIILESGPFHKQYLYIFSNEKLKDRIIFGVGINKNKWPVQLGDRAVKIQMNPNETLKIILQKVCPRYTSQTFRATIYSQEYYNQRQINYFYSLKNTYFFRILFIGILAFLCLFTIFQFIQHKDLTYLYYSGYIFIMAFYFLERHEANPFLNIFLSNNAHLFNPNGGGEPSYYSQISFIFYILFTIEFLDLRNNYKLLTRYFYALIVMIVLCYVAQLLMLFFDSRPSTIYNFYYRYRAGWNIPLLASLIWILVRVRTKLAAIYLIGSFVLTLTMIIPQFTYLLDQKLGGPFFSDNMAWMQIGILFECFIFSTGLGYKSKIVYKERDAIQQELLNKSNENILIQQKYNSKLQEEVRIKSTEVINQKEQLLKNKYEINFINLEAKMLQAKMNPHFIYNCLNSIKYFAISKTNEETAQYITDFAGLMRSILENSRENFITLKEEIAFIHKYIQIEGRRFDEKFDFKLHIDRSINLESYVPPMVLQPIIENSIKHGLLPKDDKGILEIHFKKVKEQIQIHIIDDGIGRQASFINTNTQNRYQNKTSLSSIITESRLNNIKQSLDIDIKVSVIDNTSISGQSTGTTVIINLPIIKDKTINIFK